MEKEILAEVTVDASRCEGIGYCVNIRPDLFVMDDDQPPVRVLRQLTHDGELQAGREAEEMCPTQALHVQLRKGSS